MSETTPPSADRRRLLQDALRAIDEMRRKVETLERARTEPIAIVGLACRFPGGADGPEEYWRLLRDGVDAISEVPSDRWSREIYARLDPEAAGRMPTQFGGFLDRIDQFDPHFFGIAPREAVTMDPQQRIVLEVCWEALENAGQAPDGLRGSATGVFVGITANDYVNQLKSSESLDVYSATGNAHNAAAGRVSYTLGLQGPSMALDTACSSSLTAIHVACQALRTGECNLALAGGVNVIASPGQFVSFFKWGMIAPDGRCKTFDAAADGFVRAEGCGIVVLKRLSDAIADRDNVLAVIRGTAVNQDGASSGLTVPNGLAQEAVIRQALRFAGIAPREVGYVEAHGTGTTLGDPIELEALDAVLGEGRPSDRPLVVGSVKTNLGHLESAAGVAGLIKAVLALHHQEIPPHLHFKRMTPAVTLRKTSVVIPTAPLSWLPKEGRRIAGVSSFGFSGTNAHIVMEEAPTLMPAATSPGDERPVHLLTLSAKSEPALARLAERYARHFERHPQLDLASVCFTAGAGRARLASRLALVATSLEDARAKLLAAAAAPEAEVSGVVKGRLRTPDRPRVAFLFTGQGSQYAGMGRQLYETEAAFREALDRCDAILAPLLPKRLLSVLYGEETSLLDDTAYTQPGLFAVEYALSELWRSWGIEPSAVMGHSIGEYVAACVAGVITLEDALSLVAARGQLMGALPSGGGMTAVLASEERVRPVISRHGSALSLAAVNGPESVVISGEIPALEAVEAALGREGIRTKRLVVSHAFHSALMEPMLSEFERRAGEVSYAPPEKTLISNVTGRALGAEECGAGYWRRHAREAVRFADGMKALWEQGYRVFLEVGPSPTLLGMGRQCVAESEAAWIPSLRKDREDWREMLGSAGLLFTRGVDLDWARFDRGYPRRKVALPTYPFERQRYWAEGPSLADRDREAAWAGRAPSTADRKEVVFESLIGPQALPYLADHRIYGAVVLPATAYLEMGLAAGEETLGPGVHVLEDVVISEAMVLPVAQDRMVQVKVTPEADGASIEVLSRAADAEGEWRLHATGRVREAKATSVPETLDAIRARCTAELPVAAQYEALRAAGIDFGPSFRGLVGLWAGDGEAVGQVRLPEAATQGADGYRVHPALLDACFQVMGGAVARGDGRAAIYLPLGVERVGLYARAGADVWSHVRVRPEAGASGETVVADIWVLDDAGQAVARLEGLRLARATPEALQRVAQPAVGEWFYEVAWRAQPLDAAARAKRPARAGTWLVLADGERTADALIRSGVERGESFVVARPGPAFAVQGDGLFQVDPARPDDLRRLVREAAGRNGIAGVVHLWNRDAASAAGLRGATALGSGSLLHLTQALAELRQSDPPRLWVVTRDVHAGASLLAASGLEQAPAWGLARTIAAEHPELQCVCIDLDAATGEEAGDLLRAEVESRSGEDQVAYRAGRRHVARLVSRSGTALAEGQPLELEIETRGILEELRLRPASRRRPGPGEVEIRVSAAALNFRDVLNAMGVYEGPPGPMGSECAGRIVAVGEGVQGLAEGQEVVAMTAGAFRTHVTTPAAFVVAMPRGLSLEEAAAAPIAFLTAEYALTRLGGMKAGDRVLIHAGTGGVGLAAVQLAQRAGAEIFATAGSDEKRAYLRSLGVPHVMDSRSLSFAEETMRASGGEGVDLVLNSLTGDFIPKSLDVLRRGGRFLEIGKAGIWSLEQMKEARPDVSYFPIYLGEIDPGQMRSMLVWLREELDSGALRPLPTRTFPLTEASSAFRFMAQAKHIGKIVLTDEAAAPAVRADATYLITGGLGSLGRLVAQWLVGRGARRLVLTGRSAPSAAVRDELAALRSAGAEVVVAQGDISDDAFIPALMAEIGRSGLPLRGIVHAAGLLDDGVLAQQSWERFERVLAPKVSGAWNLHAATRGMPLDFFVLFSSAASLLGSPGQGNYAAANAYLDALAHHRRATGLPALSINWGPWADVGMAAGLGQRDQERMTRQGLRSLTPEEGMAVFARLLGQASPQVGVLPLDLPKFLAPFPAGSEPPLLAELARGRAREKAPRATALPDLLVEVEQAPAGRRRGIVLSHVRGHVLGVLGLDASSTPDSQQGLRDLGMDSLMAIELRNRLQRSVGASLPPTLAFDFPTIDALTDYLLEHVPALDAGRVDARAPEVSVAASARPHDGDAEPIAIIGLGCRFPGGSDTPQAYWRMLRAGVDAIREVPADRWDVDAFYDPDPDAAGKMYTRHGAFIEDVDRFDSSFFGISPREAVSLDPQHRLLLEVSWEAMERAGQTPDRLMGSRTGVFIGISSNDYALMQFKAMEAAGINAYFGIGSSASAAAGRLSYFLGLQGPCLAVDTACSSSLVAVHLASQSLRQGECRTALVAGVNLILTPEVTINFCRARMLAADGRCKTFDASADGYVRSEGCGAVVLKRLSDAIADGDPVLAVIRGSAVNQDGRSGGLTVPNGPAQEALIREALAMAGVAPADVGYVEAHGTGTSLGDPIEMQALGAVMREGRSVEHPVVVGSVKTNMGHLEAAAGVAGLIKVVLALQNEEIPPHLHYKELNPHISVQDIPAVIPTTLVPWPREKRPRVAGISSFGFAGTNAHLVIGEAPESAPHVAAVRERPRHILTLSAKTEGALQALASRFAEAVEAAPESVADVAFSAHTGRGQFGHRLAVVASTAAEVTGPLTAFAAGESPASVIRGEFVGRDRPEVAFLFTGQGSQYVGMGRELYETQPTFRAALERCQELLRGELDRPLLSVLYPRDGEASPLDETAYTQPSLFALEWALLEMWRSWGVQPAAVMGHSVGEFVAACAAGVFSLEDALKLVAARGRLMQALPSGGAMAAVMAGEERVRAAIAAVGAAVSIAAVNGPASVVLSGAESEVVRLLAELERDGVRTKRLVVSHAFHSELMDPMLGELERVAAEVRYSAPRIPLVSNVTGQVVRDEVASASYWRRHAREAVRFAAGTAALWQQGYRLFVEVGPSPTLLGMARQCVAEEEALWLPTLRAPRDEWSQVLDSLGRLYVSGVPIDWAGFDHDYARRKVALPTYPFQRQRHWIEAPTPVVSRGRAAEPAPGLYEVAWRPQPRVEQTSDGVEPGTWLVLADAAGAAETVIQRLQSRGDRTVVVRPGESYEPGPRGSIRLDPARPEDFGRLWADAVEGGLPLRGVVHLWSLDDPAPDALDSASLDRASVRDCAAALHLLAPLARTGGAARPRLFLVTRGAQPVGAATPLAVSQAPLWGLARTIAVEHPELHCTSVDLDPGRPEEIDPLWLEMAAPPEGDQIAFRDGVRLVPRLTPTSVPAPAQPLALRSEATYLITGGQGGLGLRVSQWMVERGARHLVLTGRRGATPETAAAIAALAEQGADVRVIQADVARESDVAALAARLAEMPPLAGVVHAAGVLSDGVLQQQDWTRFAPVLAPKVLGAWNLHRALAGASLDFFVMFSSSSAVLGSPGQGNYAAANAFLDALAHHRRALGLPGLSLNWGPWAGVGMAGGVASRDRQRWAASGVNLIAPDEGLAALERALAAPALTQVAVLGIDWSKFLAPFAAAEVPPLFAELARAQGTTAAPARAVASRPDLLRQVEEEAPHRRAALVLAHVREQVAHVLGVDAEHGLHARQGFQEMGLDSLMAVELRNRLQTSVGRALPSTLAFDFPTIQAVAGYLTETLAIDTGAAPRAKASTAARERVASEPNEPIAIIGLGCRFPGGAVDSESFWRLLSGGVDAVTLVPRERWDVDAFFDADPDVPGKMYTRWGGFLEGIDRFDPRFFGIAPREVASMDPQQRLLLEVTWEALEHAGQAADRLEGSATGVFVGISVSEYASLQLASGDPSHLHAYIGTGNALSVAAGRISFLLGLQGPCLAVDTACSSSLVAVHLAAQSLRQGECRLAVAGGVNLTLTPEMNVVLSKARMMAADGRCKTFDAAADGYVRGEGCGVVVLKRVSDALADGDRILAVVRGTAINQDGRSSGLTVPNGPAQEAVLKQALANGGVAPAEVAYVEAHGTGTSLGDPIEIHALGAVLGEGRDADRPLLVGSVKTNVGHLEAAAGIAGLIKVVLSLQHEEIPPHLHFQNPSPHIAWGQVPVAVPTVRTPWPAGGRRIAGVSSFGFSGTNSHVVLEEAPAVTLLPAAMERPLHLLSVSAKDEEPLRALAHAYESHLAEHPELSLADAAFTANAGRAHLEQRLTVVAASAEEARATLRAFAEGESPAAMSRGTAGRDHREVVFLFTGQGSQYAGMGRQLYATQPTFRKAMDRCDEILRPLLPRPLLSVLYPETSERSPLDDTAFTQPALFALEWSLSELWRSWGIEPAAVMGHSVGEFVAACVAGVFSLEDGLALVAARGRLMGSLPAGGAMLAIAASEERVREALASLDTGSLLSIAAINGPEDVVVAGPEGAVDGLAERLAGVRTKRLVVSHAFHSALMDPVLEELERVAAGVSYAPPRMGIVSNVTGRMAREEIGEPGYWRRHAREAVRFADGMAALWEQGYRVFVEVGPSPTLMGMGQRCVGSEEAVWLPTLRPAREDWAQVLETLGRLHVGGVTVDWVGFDRDYPRRKVSLPTYPFQRQRFWAELPERSRPQAARAGEVHPLLGHRVSSALRDVLFDARIDADALPYLSDHRVYGNVVVPAAVYLEMGLAAAAQTLGRGPHVVENVSVSEPLILVPGSERMVQVIVTPQDGEPSRFQVFSRAGGNGAETERWHLHAAATLRDASDAERTVGAPEALAAIRERLSVAAPVAAYYDALRASGIEFGPAFQAIAEIWSGEGEALGRLDLPAAVEGGDGAYGVHPVLLDAGFQLLGAAQPQGGRDGDQVYLPVGLDRLFGRGGRPAWAHVRTKPEAGGGTLSADVRFFDAAGEVVAAVEGLHLRRASQQSLRRAQQSESREWLYEVVWSPEEGPSDRAAEESGPGLWLVFADRGGVGASLGRRLAARGQGCLLVRPGESYLRADAEGTARVDPAQPEHFERLYRELLSGGERPVRGVVHLWTLDGEVAPEGGSSLRDAMLTSCGSLLHVLRALASAPGAAAPRLWVVTQGGQAVAGTPVVPAQAAAGGLARTIATEHPELRCTSVDLDPATGEAESHADALSAEIAAPDREDRIAYRGGRRHRARLARCAAASPASGSGASAGEPVALEVGVPGILDELRLQPATRRAPGPGEVEIRVVATGLNFRDVLNALGVYEGPPGPLGSECAGRISAVGEGVRGLEVGRPVVAMAPDTFRTYVTVPAPLVAAIPEGMSFGEAATIPVTFLTAEYALNQLGRMKAGERVLIHAGAGGVGLAAIQVAQRAGAEVFATAGSDEKRAYLRSLGVAHVMDSRSVSFADAVMKESGGEGVDLVLNSLTGDFIPKSLDVLRRGGRFLEIGKAGIWSPEQMAAARPDVSYFPIYLGLVEPDRIQQMLTGLLADFAAGHLRPLRRREFPLEAAPSAFRHMAQAKHIGKVVLVHHDGGAEGVAPRGGSTYLVTGGLGSLGLRIARWLVEQGASHLVLVGRREPSEEARKVIAACAQAGAEVRVAAADVSHADDVDRVMAMIAAEMPPLRGIVHAAGVLDDGVLSQMTWPRFEGVLEPKVIGGYNLHRATQGTRLDFFVMFASVAGVLGNAGQGPYGAANAFLDGLAHHRRALGQPALSIDWGPWGDTGMAASLGGHDQQRWADVGLAPIPPDEGMAVLERLLDSGLAQVTVLPVQWPRFLAQFEAGSEPRLFAEVAREVRPGASARTAKVAAGDLRKRLEAAAPGKRRRVVLASVREHVLKVLALDSSQPLDDQQGFQALGMDSLMAVELRNRLQTATGRALSSTLAFDYPTVEAIAGYLATEVFGLEPEVDEEAQRAAAEQAEREAAQRSADLAELEGLSDDEAEALLLQELEANRKAISG